MKRAKEHIQMLLLIRNKGGKKTYDCVYKKKQRKKGRIKGVGQARTDLR
jgi:hypothetical protein